MIRFACDELTEPVFTSARMLLVQSPTPASEIVQVTAVKANPTSKGLEGWGLGLGLFYVGEREGDLNNSFTLPSYFRTDASIFYKRDCLRAAVSIKNLFNVDYYESSSDILRVFPGEPLTVQGTISWQF